MGINEIRALKGAGNLYPAQKAAVKALIVRAPKPAKKPAVRSEKQKAVVSELKKLYPIFLRKHPVCEIDGPQCQKKAVCVHHSEGRGVNEVLKQSSWVASCAWCNGWVETADAQARKNGFKKSRLKKSQ